MTQTIFKHNVLPEAAQNQLRAAAKTPGAGNRDEAIDRATATIKDMYPLLFNEPPDVIKKTKTETPAYPAWMTNFAAKPSTVN